MSAGNTLSDRAIRDLRLMKSDIRTLKERVGRMGGRQPREGKYILAFVESNIQDNTYSGYQVRAVQDNPQQFEQVPNGIGWGNGSAAGYLYSYDYTNEDATGVVRAWPYSDGTKAYWGFQWTDTEDDYDFLLKSWDGNNLNVRGGHVQVGNDATTVEELNVNDASVGDYVWIEIDGSMDNCFLYNYDITTNLLYGDIGSRWIEDSTGDFTAKIQVGQILDENTFDQDQVGSFAALDWARGSSPANIGTIDADVIHEVNTDTDDQVLFKLGELDNETCRGLVKSQSWLENQDQKAITSVNWIGISKGQIRHRHNKDPWVTLSWDMTADTVSNGTLDGSTLDCSFDTQGHMYRYCIDGTCFDVPPEDASNHLYTHCSDQVTYPAIITDQSHDFIAFNNQCYEYDSTTTGGTNATVDGTYTSCADCSSDFTNELWKDCTTDTSVALLSPGHTTADYAWLCIGGVYKKSYDSGFGSGTATDPTVLEQCGSTPTSCNDLVGVESSDTFSGVDCNSGSIGDKYFDVRWFENNSGGSNSISGGNLITSSPSGTKRAWVEHNVNASGDLTVTADIDSSSVDTSGNNFAFLYCEFGSNVFEVRIQGVGGLKRVRYYNGSTFNDIAYTGSITVEFKRTGTTVTTKINSTTYDTRLSATGNLDRFIVGTQTNSSSISVSSTTADVTIETGLGAAVYIDPTGNACT